MHGTNAAGHAAASQAQNNNESAGTDGSTVQFE